jgi:hypothetical protein
MFIRSALLLAAITAFSGGIAHAQPAAAPPPSGKPMQGMGNMPGMSSGSSADMPAMVQQCARMKAQMKAGMKMTPDMQPMMDRCTKMDASKGATKAPDDTLSR